MSQAWGPEVTTLKRNFCFYIRKTGRQTQGLEKLGMRSSQKMSRSVPVSEQPWDLSGVNSTDCHTCASNGTSGKFRFHQENRTVGTPTQGDVSALVQFCPVMISLLSKSVCWYFSQYFPFSKVSVSLHILRQAQWHLLADWHS